MDNDLQRSIQFLQDALSTPHSQKKPVIRPSTKSIFNINELPIDLQKSVHKSVLYESTLSSIVSEPSVIGSIIQTEAPWKNTVDSLFIRFVEALQCDSNNFLDVAEDLARCCSDALNVIEKLKSQVNVEKVPEEQWLELEKNTWRLLFLVYQERINVAGRESRQFVYSGHSEELCIKALFRNDNTLRESQLIVDWLERNALERDDPILHQSDWTYGWEHTMHELKAPENITIRSRTEMVKNLHPDAPHFENRRLHHLDEDNEKKLNLRMFTEIRCGKLGAAQQLLSNCGHSWKAAMLEGWKLYHNPLAENEHDVAFLSPNKQASGDNNTCEDIRGNVHRDLWKSMAFDFCKQESLNIYERASIAAFCGYLDVLLQICVTWEDYLWAYFKTLIDIRVELEIRNTIVKDYIDLPEEYWNQKMSLNDVFNMLESNSSSHSVRVSCQDRFRIIQKYVILENISGLILLFAEWAEDENTSTHFLRFLAHLVLFFSNVERGHKKESEKVMEMYIQRLSRMNETAMVAFYCSQLSGRKQVVNYARHLENVTDHELRKLAIGYGEHFGLDMHTVTELIVDSIRNQPVDIPAGNTLNCKTTPQDELKISTLDWLLFYDVQLLEAIVQSNIMICTFLSVGKFEAAQRMISKIPSNVLERLSQNHDEFNDAVNLAIKEHLSYKTYLDGHEAFNKWFKQFQLRPKIPDPIPQSAHFTEKVAYQHRLTQYESETKMWNLTTSHVAKTAKGLLYNVLLFPDGWLVGSEHGDYLRSMCIPEVCLLLYKVLFEMEMYTEAIQLADLVANEVQALYKVFPQDKLTNFLEILAECSLALLNNKKDPWGQEPSA